MANEISLTTGLAFSKDGTTINVPPPGNAPASVTIDVAGTNAIHHRQTLSTSPEALELGEVTPGGIVYLKNTSSTAGENIVIMTATGGTDVLVLKPGEQYPIRFDAGITAPAAKSDVGTPELEYVMVDD